MTVMIATTNHQTIRNPSICFVRNALAGVLCVMPADAPTVSKWYVAIAVSGCAPIVGTAMIYADAMVIVRVAALRLIAVPMDGLVASVTSGYVLGAVGATIRARNAALERNRIMTMSNLSPLIYIMASFASSAAAGPSTASSVASSVALPKVLTEYFVEGTPYDTYKIPAGTRLFKSYRDTLAKWSPDKVFPLRGPAYFGFDEPNVSKNYGFAFAYKTTQSYELLAIDSQKTLAYLWGLAKDRADVRNTLTKCFGYDPKKPEKQQIRTSDEDLDYVLVDFLCDRGFEGYAGDYIAASLGGRFHPECVMCDPIHVKLNTEYNVNRIPGLASPDTKHPGILRMLMDRNPDINPQKPNPDTNKSQPKRSLNMAYRFFESEDSENEDSESEDSENKDPNKKKLKTDDLSSRKLLTDFGDDDDKLDDAKLGDAKPGNDDAKLGGGSRRKKRTQRKQTQMRHKWTRRHKRTQIRHKWTRRHKRTQMRHKQNKIKSRK